MLHGDFWLTFHMRFRYRGSIEYRNTRDGIVITVPISGIALHYGRLARWSNCLALATARLSCFEIVTFRQYRWRDVIVSALDCLPQHLLSVTRDCFRKYNTLSIIDVWLRWYQRGCKNNGCCNGKALIRRRAFESVVAIRASIPKNIDADSTSRASWAKLGSDVDPANFLLNLDPIPLLGVCW